MLLETRIFDVIGVIVLIFSTCFAFYMEKEPFGKKKISDDAEREAEK